MLTRDGSKEQQCLARRTQIFRDAFVRHCHELLARGYARLDAASFQVEEEPVITGKLVLAMNDTLESSDAPSWAAHFLVLDDPPVNSPERTGKRRRRVDIELIKTQRGTRPRLQFEAKRLYNNGSVAAYLGANGLGLFLNGDYAAEHDTAGMLGYVQAGELGVWVNEIENKLGQERTRHAVREDGDFRRQDLTPSLDHTYHSKHDRATVGKSITIFHTLLRFN